MGLRRRTGEPSGHEDFGQISRAALPSLRGGIEIEGRGQPRHRQRVSARPERGSAPRRTSTGNATLPVERRRPRGWRQLGPEHLRVDDVFSVRLAIRVGSPSISSAPEKATSPCPSAVQYTACATLTRGQRHSGDRDFSMQTTSSASRIPSARCSAASRQLCIDGTRHPGGGCGARRDRRPRTAHAIRYPPAATRAAQLTSCSANRLRGRLRELGAVAQLVEREDEMGVVERAQDVCRRRRTGLRLR